MISERHKTNNLVTIWILICLPLLATTAGPVASRATDEVYEVLPQSATTTTTTATKSGNRQDEVNVVVTPVPRVDPNNNNEWRPLGHGDPLQKDPTYDYSPPALDRVRYWAENNGSSSSSSGSSSGSQDARQQKLPKTKNEILLLGMSGERDRERTRHQQQQQQQQLKQQQAKYAAIRRSYYAPQQQQLLQIQQQQHQQQQQQQHMPHTHLMPPPMMMKGHVGHVEYRHNVINSPSSSSYMSYTAPALSSPSPASSSASHYYSSPAASSTSPWYSHSSLPMSVSMSMPHRLSYADTHHQESMQHYSFSRPNSIHAGSSVAAPRKPWLHELLQKELVKPTMKQRMKPTMPATKYLMGTTRPATQSAATAVSPFASFNYAPVTFVPGPPTVDTPTTSKPMQEELYVTPPTTQTPSLGPILPSIGFQPVYTTTTSATTTTSRPPPSSSSMPTPSSSRLMIPQLNNLAQRPTVAPAPELTTDALFSHYKQPPKPLLGPMYLIIEGHSKVKTYGQNELDPHSPKIVPVISKREPVVRIADPNEQQRGTVETYQVKHLHIKTMPLTTTTTTTSTVAPTTQRSTTTTASSSSTTAATTTTTTTTVKPIASAAAAAAAAASGSGVDDLLSLLDNMFANAHEIVSSSTEASTSAYPSASSSSSSTILRPVTMKTKLLPPQLPQLPEPRIGSQAGSIDSLIDDEEVNQGAEIATSTEPAEPARATRQIFDYDQLPESRIKAKEAEKGEEGEELDYEIGEDDDDEQEEEQIATAAESLEDNEHNLLKRIDKFVDDVDDGDDDLDDLIEDLSPGADDDDNDDVEEEDEERKQHK